MLSRFCLAHFHHGLDTHLKLLDCAVSGAQFLTWSVFECDIVHRLSVAVLCMLYKIRYNPMHPHNGALYLEYMCQCGLHTELWSYVSILMRHLIAEHCSTVGFLLPSQCPSGMILLTRIRWCGTDRFQEQGQCFFIGLSFFISTIAFYYFSFSLLSV